MNLVNKIKEILGLLPKEVECVEVKDVPETKEEVQLRKYNELLNDYLELINATLKFNKEISVHFDELRKVLERKI